MAAAAATLFVEGFIMMVEPYLRVGGRVAHGVALVATAALVLVASHVSSPVVAQGTDATNSGPLQPGEGFVTRFSGIRSNGGQNVIDTDGTVGSIIDLRAPRQPPIGQHWIDEPQRARITAGQTGQVFGVALDDAEPPNIYVTATSAFGLHRDPGGRGWMPGMWGPGGGPGTVYKLDRSNGYQPRIFSNVTLNGRENTGPGLGNITYDRFNRQFIVSDMETGVIHRLRASDGADLGTYDHGRDGRPRFLDVQSGQAGNLPAKVFDPSTAAQVGNCPAEFDRSPECWNYAYSGRRPWGIGVWQDTAKREVRLFYAIWSGPAFGNRNWANENEADKRNAIWSIRLGPDGGFDTADVRREFELPDFFQSPEQIAASGYSSPVSDITFSQCGERPIMLVAERGGIRNLGLGAEAPFSQPHEARSLRYELDQNGAWRPVGRYDVGFYDRNQEGQPFVRANCSGGIAFGPGYDPRTWTADLAKKDQFVWMSGHMLCSPLAPCRLPGADASGGTVQPAAAQGGTSEGPGEAETQQGAGDQAGPDDSQVHGIQGTPENVIEELLPAQASRPYPSDGEATPANGPLQSYLIDTDINIDGSGGLIEEELVRNDATKIGDIVIYQPCAPPRPVGSSVPASFLLPPPPREPPTIVGHALEESHARVSSHGTDLSHSRYGSHNFYWSHSRWSSHNTSWSHSRDGSHGLHWSHSRWGSHGRRESHNRLSSHRLVLSHYWQASHGRFGSHGRHHSHDRYWSHNRNGSHDRRLSHGRLKSHDFSLSHGRLSSHTTGLSHSQRGSHNLALSHSRLQSHSVTISKGGNHDLKHSKGSNHGVHVSLGTHDVAKSKSHGIAASKNSGHSLAVSKGSGHSPVQSKGAHSIAESRGGNHGVAPSHLATQSKAGGHSIQQSRGGGHTLAESKGQHGIVQSRGGNHGVAPSHLSTQSKGGGHSLAESKNAGSHNQVLSKGGGGHTIALSKGTHLPAQSKGGGHSLAESKGGSGHSPVMSKGPIHLPAQSKSGGHTAVESKGTTSHTTVQSRGVKGHTVALSRGSGGHATNTSKAASGGGHNPVQSKGTTAHTTVQSRGSGHNLAASSGAGKKERPGRPQNIVPQQKQFIQKQPVTKSQGNPAQQHRSRAAPPPPPPRPPANRPVQTHNPVVSKQK